MNAELDYLYNNLRNRLISDFEFKESAGNLIKGKCPSCGQKSLYTKHNNHWKLYCERLNNCGAVHSLKEIYCHEFEQLKKPEQIIKKNVATTANPKATAIAYLEQVRGLEVNAFINDFDQGAYFRKATNFQTPTVRFWIDKKEGIYWERLIKPEPQGKNSFKKASFAYGKEWAGLWWQKSTQKIDSGDTVYIVEGIFDALALNQAGFKAVASLSAVFPYKSIKPYLNKKIKWVLAYDNDQAGSRTKRKFKDFFKLLNRANFQKSGLTNEEKQELKNKNLDNLNLNAQIEFAIAQVKNKHKEDWNDLLLKNQLNELTLNQAIENGAIEFADSAKEKAFLIFLQKRAELETKLFSFEFEYKLYKVELDLKKINEIENQLFDDEADEQAIFELLEKTFPQYAEISQIANFNVECRFFEFDEKTSTELYALRFFAKQNKNQKEPEVFDLEVTGEQLTVNSSFKSFTKKMRFLNWRGSANDLDYLYADITRNLDLTVQTQNYIGYNPQKKAYVFNDFAIFNGKTHLKNDDGFFQMIGKNEKTNLTQKINLKSNIQSPHFLGNLDELNLNLWTKDFFFVYGLKGLATLAFFTGSLFATQLRQSQFGAFPFMEVYGDAGSGKSTMVRFIWKLFGRNNEEGFSANNATKIGFLRKISQLSNIPSVIIESDSLNYQTANNSKLNLNDLRELYNGGTLSTKGVKTAGNETYEPEFLTSLLFVQNLPIDGEGEPALAIKSRLISIFKGTRDHTPDKALRDQELKLLQAEQISGFYIEILKQEDKFLTYVLENLNANKRIFYDAEISSERVIFNHALLYTISVYLLIFLNEKTGTLFSAPQYLQDFYIKLARTKETTLNGNPPLVVWFWEAIEFLASKGVHLNHAEGKGGEWDSRFAINLNEFLQALSEQKLQMPANVLELKRELKNSKSPKFLDVAKIRTGKTSEDFSTSATRHCWIFEREKTKMPKLVA